MRLPWCWRRLSSPALAAGPALTAQPPASPIAASDTRSGVLTLAGGAYAYLPKGRTGAPAPVLVALHGAGGQASQVLDVLPRGGRRQRHRPAHPAVGQRHVGHDRGFEERGSASRLNVQPRYGKDLKAIDAALADLFTRVAVDPARIGIMGFSDGATYALSVGTANPQLFRQIIAFSPGPAFLGKSAPGQSVFISHGENDKVLPFSDRARARFEATGEECPGRVRKVRRRA